MSEDPIVTRKLLPEDLIRWRNPGKGGMSDELIWEPLHKFFQRRGYTYWVDSRPPIYLQSPPDDRIENNGYAFATALAVARAPSRTVEPSFGHLFEFSPPSPLMRAARTKNGHDVIIRVLAMDSLGQDVVDVLKQTAISDWSLADRNHTLPVLEFIDFAGITFGVFPKVGAGMRDAYASWPKNSVGDVVAMILQCLEGLSFIHWLGIAHRDAFKDNFLVQFHPESLNAGCMSSTRPRVYLHDFETAVIFPLETPEVERVCVGKPHASTFTTEGDHYGRPLPPEVLSGKPYNPFKLDVWQFGTSLSKFKTTIPAIDEILEELRDPDAATRPSAVVAFEKLSDAVASITPKSLLIAPEIAND